VTVGYRKLAADDLNTCCALMFFPVLVFASSVMMLLYVGIQFAIGSLSISQMRAMAQVEAGAKCQPKKIPASSEEKLRTNRNRTTALECIT
jgi:hypothetical protein